MSLGIRKKYELLYKRLKSEGINYLERPQIPDDAKEEIARIIRDLPHPRVASIWDIADVCRECTSGKLEYLYGFFGKDASQLRQEIENVYPEERKDGVLLPPSVPAEETSIQDLARMIGWSNEILLGSYSMLRKIGRATDIILKGQCPYCMGDLVEVIVSSELRLRCKSQTKPACRSVDWLLGNVSKRSPP